MPSESVAHCPSAISVTFHKLLTSFHALLVYVMGSCLFLCICHSSSLTSAHGISPHMLLRISIYSLAPCRIYQVPVEAQQLRDKFRGQSHASGKFGRPEHLSKMNIFPFYYCKYHSSKAKLVLTNYRARGPGKYLIIHGCTHFGRIGELAPSPLFNGIRIGCHIITVCKISYERLSATASN